MKISYHVLNGDALFERFPQEIMGEKIVIRECLMDGPTNAANWEEFYAQRTEFIRSSFDDKYSLEQYKIDCGLEYEKILHAEDGSEFNLWFEDDLYCQVNLWFTINFILKCIKNPQVFLIRPDKLTAYGFGAYNNDSLKLLLKKKQHIKSSSIEHMAHLWSHYSLNNSEPLILAANILYSNFPFILKACRAHLGRMSEGNKEIQPLIYIKQIMKELNTNSFVDTFKEFCKRHPIYGYGDLQFRLLWEKAQ